MIVVDASVLVEVVASPHPAEALTVLPDEPWCIPHLADSEVLHVLRRLERSGRLDRAQASAAVDEMGGLDLFRYPVEPLRERIWELRDNLTAYDAAYVALAEALEAPLYTADARMASAPGLRTTIHVIG